MSKHATDLALAVHRHDARLEAPMTLEAVTGRMNARTYPYSREGLGTWRAFFAGIEGYVDLVVATPDDMEGAGCSIWYTSGETLDHRVVASLLYVLAGDEESMFLDPASGEPVEPDPKLLQRPEPLADLVHVDQTPIRYEGAENNI